MRVLYILSIILLLTTQAFANPVTLQDSLKNAFTYSPLLQSSKEALTSKSFELDQAKAAYLPTIGIWASAGAQQESSLQDRKNNYYDNVIGVGKVGLTLSQKIWDGGARSANVEANENNYQYGIYNVLDTANSLAFTTLSVHLDIIRRQQILEVTKKNLQAHENLLYLLDQRFQQGLSSRGDLDQGRTRLHKLNATYQFNLNALEVAKLNYKKLTGANAPAEFLAFDSPSRVFTDPLEVQKLSMESNSQIHMALEQVDISDSQRKIAESAYYPTFSFDISPAYQSKNTDDNEDIYSWDAMLNMQWNLFNGGADKARVQAQSAKIREARNLLVDTRDVVFEQISISFSNLTTVTEQSEFYAKAVGTSLAMKNNFYEQFNVGQKDLLNLLDAEAEYYSSQVEYIIAQSDIILGQYRLHALAGTLIDELKINNLVGLANENSTNSASLTFSE